ncbi:MAG: hypothetical protein LH473_09395, partial [Chitinophagales bacterium]|nr:hypothetical protein [Chitinophagales bacterium]
DSITVELPKTFLGNEVDVIVMASEKPSDFNAGEEEILRWKNDLIKFCEQYSIDISKQPFNRDELYDRS